MPLENRVETEQHDRREGIEQLRCSSAQTGGQVHEAAAVEQIHASAVHLVPFEVATQVGAGMLIPPVDIDLTVAVANVHEDRAIGEALDLSRSDHAIETGRSDDHAGSTNSVVEVGYAAAVVLRLD